MECLHVWFYDSVLVFSAARGKGRGRFRNEDDEDGAGGRPSGPSTLFDFLESKMGVFSIDGGRLVLNPISSFKAHVSSAVFHYTSSSGLFSQSQRASQHRDTTRTKETSLTQTITPKTRLRPSSHIMTTGNKELTDRRAFTRTPISPNLARSQPRTVQPP